MSEVFEGYERQYCELSANLSRKCSSTSLVSDPGAFKILILLSFSSPLFFVYRLFLCFAWCLELPLLLSCCDWLGTHHRMHIWLKSSCVGK